MCLPFNPLSASVFLIKTSQLICCANQLTGFYARATLARNELIWINIKLSDTSSYQYAKFDWFYSLIKIRNLLLIFEI